jgi:aminocarboxymuconate-semialdehyde decarboxylase
MVADLHSHYFPLGAAASPDAAVTVREVAGGDRRQVCLRVGGHDMVVPTAVVDVVAQRADADAQGLSARALLPPPFTVLYELDGPAGTAWARTLNEHLAEDAATDRERLIGFATVPLQAGGAVAAAELDHAVTALGLRGVTILTSVAGRGLDDPVLAEFWAAAAELGVPVVVHPHYVVGAERMGTYHLRNLVGNPTETALAGTRLLYSGLLVRHPGLRVVLCHGGGALPHIIGRLRHGYRNRPELADATDPADGLRRLYYDTVVFDPVVLRHLVELVGADRVVVGSDFPFDMAEPRPVGFVTGSGLSAGDTDTILRSADRLLTRSDRQPTEAR